MGKMCYETRKCSNSTYAKCLLYHCSLPGTFDHAHAHLLPTTEQLRCHRVQGFTHLLLPHNKFTRSIKQLLAVAAAAPIVTPAWLEACHAASECMPVTRPHCALA